MYSLILNHNSFWQISPGDIQWVGEDPGISHRGGYRGSGHEINRSVGRDRTPAAGRGRGVGKGQSRKDFLPLQNGVGKKVPDDIQIRNTDTLIKEVSACRWIPIFHYKFVESYIVVKMCILTFILFMNKRVMYSIVICIL